ncbi:DUF1000-domain-containing protein [Sistotremastrum niveocremeum HHB9708]|uniref:DUF1000-domain-containing protein n=2 Tax=Sistotremastraceae TaxID=3402574 RepID=A0A164XU54_9AGAM|nr:DUF1000-domain-containing protein [Sistotremastrum niveocremeum HHB9708]KZT37025.1 DUF1000-domain-containing protein [Sistotremastrum suecicum HHB10207 ss-3]
MADPEHSIVDHLAGSDTTNLYAEIDRDNVHGLNLAVPEDARAIIKTWDQREDTSVSADSGVDDQLIIHIPFTQQVRIRSILVKVGRGEVAPTRLRVYANYPTIIDFADAEAIKPHINMSLLEGQVAVTEYPVRAAAFTSINSLSLFFSESSGGDMSRIYYIGFKGDVRSPQREPGNRIDVRAQNAADASIVDRVGEKSAARQSTIR